MSENTSLTYARVKQKYTKKGSKSTEVKVKLITNKGLLEFYSEILLAVTVTPSVRRGSFHKDCFVKNRLEAELSQTTRCPTMYFQPNTGNTETLSHKYMKYRYTQNRKMAKERYLYQEKTLVGVEPNNQIIDNVFFTKYRRQVFSQKYMSYSSVTFQEPRKRCIQIIYEQPFKQVWTLVQPNDNIIIRQASLLQG